jgi:hypothetical protein
MPNNSETIALRVTAIGGQRYADDYQVIWRDLPIGRIMRASGVPAHAPQWSWTCNFLGKPGGGSGRGTDLDDCKAQFKITWVRIRAELTEADIATAVEYADASAEALARYDRKRGK